MRSIKDKMNKFFHQSFSKEMTEEWQKQMLRDRLNREQDESLHQIWQELDTSVGDYSVQKDEVWRYVSQVINGGMRLKKERYSLGKCLQWAAVWLLPLCMMGSSLYLYYRAQSLKQEVTDISMQQEYAVPGQIRTITLPDGSVVWLNSGSLLMYPSRFAEQNREVYLSGEGYFEITKNEACPFLVKTRASQIKVLGTHFNVSAYPEESRIVTTLKEGAIAVELKDSERTFLLTPDEQLVYAPVTGRAFKQRVDATEYISWREDDGLSFYKTPFEQVVNALQRHFKVNIHVANSHYESNQLTIHLKRDEPLENVMKLIRMMIPELKYEIYDGTVYIE